MQSDGATAPPPRRSIWMIGTTRAAAGLIALAVVILGGVLVAGMWPSLRNAISGASGKPPTATFDAARVPLVTDRVRGVLARYIDEPDFKAVAISRIDWGLASGAADGASAEREALEQCRKRDQRGDCQIYAVGSKVVLPRLPLPHPADLRAPLDTPLATAEIARITGMPASVFDTFVNQKNHKALAIGSPGYSTMMDRADVAEAIRLAVERCSDFARSPCLLVSVDDAATVMIPHTLAHARPYTVAGDPDMTDADRDRIEAIYAGKDWRAIARGGSRRFYAVSAAASETAAVEQALKACHGADGLPGARDRKFLGGPGPLISHMRGATLARVAPSQEIVGRAPETDGVSSLQRGDHAVRSEDHPMTIHAAHQLDPADARKRIARPNLDQRAEPPLQDGGAAIDIAQHPAGHDRRLWRHGRSERHRRRDGRRCYRSGDILGRCHIRATLQRIGGLGRFGGYIALHTLDAVGELGELRIGVAAVRIDARLERSHLAAQLRDRAA